MIQKQLWRNRTLTVENLVQLSAFSENFSTIIGPGDFIALTGPLGSGKTTFVRQLCEYLGVTEGVTSPSFTLLNEYKAPGVRIVHGDLYRLEEEHVESFLPELESTLLEKDTLLCLEWADKAYKLHQEWTWHLDFQHDKDTETCRHITVKGPNLDKLKE